MRALSSQPQPPQQVRGDKHQTSAFTLIELSIVLVIIGLLVGGILVGRDLIRASQLRGMVSEVEEFKTAANTFKLKYGQLPGDMSISVTPQLGFFTFTGVNAGITYGNNDGIINAGSGIEGFCAGEGSIFFYHLAQSNLIKSNSSTTLSSDTASINVGSPAGNPIPLADYLPESKAGSSFYCANYLSNSFFFMFISEYATSRKNVFTLRGPSQASHASRMEPSLSPINMYSVDKKYDDGMPLKGIILYTPYVIFSGYPFWGATASSSVCSFGGTTHTDTSQTYNANSSTGGNSITCQPVFIW